MLAVAAAIALPALVAATLGGNDDRGGTGLVTGTIWVANESADTLTAIDARTHAIVAVLRGIASPHNVQASPDGRTIWATSSSGIVAVIDASTHRLKGTVATGANPAHVVLTPDGGTAIVTNSSDDSLALIDAATLRLERLLATGPHPHGLRPAPDGRTVLVAHMGGETVAVYDIAAGRAVRTILAGRAPVQVAFAPQGGFAYASLNGQDEIVKIDLTAGRVVGSAKVTDGPVQIAVTPDGATLLVASQGTKDAPSDTVAFVETGTMTLVATLETGAGAHGVAVEPGGRQAFVTDVWAGDVAIIDLATRTVVERIQVSGAPNGVTFSALAQPRTGLTDDAVGPHVVTLPLGGRVDGSRIVGNGHQHDH